MKAKRGWIRIISLLLVGTLLVAMMGISASANDAEDELVEGKVGPFSYMVIDGEAMLMFCDWEAAGIVEIPAYADGYPVTDINAYAFAGCEQITGFSADPASRSFQAIEGVLYTFGASCLVAYPMGKATQAYAVAEGTAEIGVCAFLNCENLKEISLPDSLTTICSRAFTASGLQKIEISSNVSNIADNVFESCRDLSGITVDARNPDFMAEDGVLFNAGQTELIAYPAAAEAAAYTVPDSVRRIGDSAFLQAGNLSEIHLPDGLLEIGEEAFSCCILLKEMRLPATVEQLGANAFSYCEVLESVTIPAGIKRIPYQAFCGCVSLTHVFLPDGIETIEANAFQECANLTDIHIPMSVSEIEESAFEGCGQFSITCFTDSYAHTFALDMGIPYFLIDDITPYGDLDGDGDITPADARLALRIAAQIVTPTQYQLQAGDLDGDGAVTTSEARRILRIAAKLEAL